MEALHNYRDFASHFYRELFRSTFLSPYDRRKIDLSVQIQPDPNGVVSGLLPVGDIDGKATFDRTKSANEPAFTTTWEKLYANLFHAPLNGPHVYWRQTFQSKVKAFQDSTHLSMFSQIWDWIIRNPDRYGPVPESRSGVPSFSLLQLALLESSGTAAPAIAAQQAFYQALAQYVQSKWDPDIVPPRLFQYPLFANDSLDVPPIDLLQHMIIFTLAYYPRVSKLLLDKQMEIDDAVQKGAAFLQSVAANDPNYIYDEVNTIIQRLYVPDREWAMQPMMTGRLRFAAFVTASFDRAYKALQDLAHLPPPPEPLVNRFGKRSTWTRALDYSHLKNVPLDVLTGYAGTDKTRHRIVKTPDNEANINGTQTAMAELAVQMLCEARLSVPEQYKTQLQYLSSPIAMQAALHGVRLYRFSQTADPKVWNVDRL